jgi:hypothetical protein
MSDQPRLAAIMLSTSIFPLYVNASQFIRRLSVAE